MTVTVDRTRAAVPETMMVTNQAKKKSRGKRMRVSEIALIESLTCRFINVLTKTHPNIPKKFKVSFRRVRSDDQKSVSS